MHNHRQQVSTDAQPQTAGQYWRTTTDSRSVTTIFFLSAEGRDVSAVWTNQRGPQGTAPAFLLPAASQHVPGTLPQTVLQGQTDRTGKTGMQTDRPTGYSWPMTHSVCLHAHLSQITAIVRLCCSVRQLQLSKYTCRWENRITGQSMPYPGTLVGAVPISTSGNRNTSGWPLYITSNNKLCLGIRERWRTKSKEKLHLCTFGIWCTR